MGKPPAPIRHNDGFSAYLHRFPLFSRRRKGSLLGRLMALAYGWAALIFLIAIVSLWWTSGIVIKGNMKRQAEQWLTKFDDLGTPLFVSGESSQFKPIKKHLESFPEIAMLRYIGADGSTLLAQFQVSTIPNSTFPVLEDDSLTQLRTLNEDKTARRLVVDTAFTSTIRITAPSLIKSIASDKMLDFDMNDEIDEEVKIVGFVDLAVDFGSYQEQLSKNIFLGSIFILLFFVLTTIIGRIVIRRALRPLADLQIPLARLANGETDISVESSGDEEIAAIGQALNTTIAALQKRDQELHQLVNFDPLTGLLNRRSFNNELERERARTLLDEHTSALLFIDLDKFKDVNDTVGHAAGDELLIQVGMLFQSKVRRNDIVARLGGDEFTIILQNVSEEQTIHITKEIGTAMREFLFSFDGHTFKIHCSIGITIIGQNQSNAEELLSEADTACHEAKNMGRDCFRLFHEVVPEEILHLEGSGIRNQIEMALEEDKFSLVYLPIQDVTSKSIRAYEALVRMDVEGKTVPAIAFFSSAERFDLAPQIDEWVFKRVVKDAIKLGKKEISLSVNLSSRTLQHENLVNTVREQLEQHEIDPAIFVFEIPERAVVDSVTQAKNVMEQIKDLGCRIAIDDFGSSLNSINLLKNLPVDQLKIEPTLVGGICSNTFNHAVVKSIVQIARELQITSIAKQVDRHESVEALKEIGVDMVQGFHIGRPLTELPSSEVQSETD